MVEYLRNAGLVVQVFFVVSCGIIGLILRSALRRFGVHLSRRSGLGYADIVLSNLGTAVLWCSTLVGLMVVISAIFHPEWFILVINPLLWSLAILVVAISIARLLREVIMRQAERRGSGREASTLIQVVVQVSVYSLALIMILDTFSIKVTTIIATLGIGGIALALALQDTLSNLFAGMYITLAGQIRVGDFVQFDSYEGVIRDIGWRTTVIKRANESIVVVPNNKLSQMSVASFPFDAKSLGGRLSLWVSAASDIDKIETVAQYCVAKGQQENLPGLLPSSAAVVRVGEFKDGMMEVIVLFDVADYASTAPVRHFLLKSIHSVLREQGTDLVPNKA